MKEILHALTTEGLDSIATSPLGFDGFRGAAAYHDSSKDILVRRVPSFPKAVEALQSNASVRDLYGPSEAERFVLQFVFNVYSVMRDGSNPEAAFEKVWEALSADLSNSKWRINAVANLKNFEAEDHVIDICDGISVRSRSFTELRALGWTDRNVNRLVQDWDDGLGASSYLLMVEREVAKSPQNCIALDDGSLQVKLARVILALRLAAPGDVGIGRVFVSRHAKFDRGVSTFQVSGLPIVGVGRPYSLTYELAASVRAWYKEIELFDQNQDKQVRNVAFAIRSFSSMYERHFHQAEDRVLDAITALEGLWKLNSELAFRLSFRTASLLGATDDERVDIYSAISEYYKVRSKIVHGSELNNEQNKLVFESEALRDIVRRTIRGFLYLANHPAEWTLQRLQEDPDRTLLHENTRNAVRQAMRLPADAVAPISEYVGGSFASLSPRQ